MGAPARGSQKILIDAVFYSLQARIPISVDHVPVFEKDTVKFFIEPLDHMAT